ncbi:MAG: NUDIX hydrolase, partial [Comamonadaceae bacterium]
MTTLPEPLDRSTPPVGATPIRPIRQAATLILLRDGAAGMEVLMMLRAQKANDQNSGASVFPGGVLDAHDRGLHDWCCGLDDATASARLQVPAHGLDFYAAAVRECFEEAGLLLASDADGRAVTLDHLSADELAALRHAAEQSTDAMVALCGRHGWRLAVDRLAYFSHWLTPPGMPRRFDTRFFVTRAPLGQEARADGRETVAANWLPAAEALDPARGLKLMNVTRRILEGLSAFGSVDECLTHVRGLRSIRKMMPRVALAPDGRQPINVDHPAYDEVALLDPDGAGDVPCTPVAGRVVRLFEGVWRVSGGRAGTAAGPEDEHAY